MTHDRDMSHPLAAEAHAQREQAFRTLADNLPDNVSRHALDGRTLYVNRVLERTLGRPAADLLGTVPDGRFSALADALRHVGATGESVEFEQVVPGPDGMPRYHSIHVVPELGPDGRPVSVVAVGRDVTNQKATANKLEAARAEAERASNAKSRFLAAVSHDLRQPLSALAIYIDALDPKLQPSDRHFVTNMKQCIRGLNELLSNLLDLSKLDAGVVQPEVADINVDELLGKVVSSLEPKAHAKGLSLRRGRFGLFGHTDPVLFQRIVMNVVSNAIKYTEQGGVLIGCRRKHGKLWIEVWDTGIGIPADRTAEIFEEFKQLGNSERNREKGTGIGLSIVARTAALLGLAVRVHSNVGRGSVFAVELPLGAPASALLLRRPHISRPLRIALVEDNVEVAEALSYALRQAGHEVVTSPCGANIVPLLANVPPDIVISDYRLAGNESGYDVIARVRQAFGQRLPALIITGDTDPELLRKMDGNGIRLLHKPLDMEVLRGVVAELVGDDCGEPTIDGEHRDIIRLVNVLLDRALARDTDPGAFDDAFDALVCRITEHFAHEEAILWERGYEALDEHAEQHRLLLGRVRELRRLADEAGISVGQLADFLSAEVVVGHMLRWDRGFYDLFGAARADEPDSL